MDKNLVDKMMHENDEACVITVYYGSEVTETMAEEFSDYLSENFLICHTNIPPKKKLNILTRVINNISNKYDGADLKTKMDTKSALQKEYVDNKSFDIEEIGNNI